MGRPLLNDHAVIAGWLLFILGLVVLAGSEVLALRANPGLIYPMGFRGSFKGQKPTRTPAAPWIAFVGSMLMVWASVLLQPAVAIWTIIVLGVVGIGLCILVPT